MLLRKQAASAPILNLTESNPTLCRFRSNSRSLLKAARSIRPVDYRPDPHGTKRARTAVSAFYGRKGIAVDPSRIFLHPGTSEAYAFIFRLLCNSGDTILAPAPSYPLLEHLARDSDVKCSSYRLAYDGEWRIDFHSLERALAPRTRAIVLVHPNNPTGSFVMRDERKRLVEIAHRSGVALIVDEVFDEYRHRDDSKRSDSFAGESRVLTFTLGGLSKTLGLPQLKLAWAVVSGPVQVRDEAIARLEWIHDTYLSVGVVPQLMLPKLLRSAGMIAHEIGTRARRNLQYCIREVPGSGISVLTCEGGWSVILQLPRVRSDERWALTLLREVGIYVHPGHFYGLEQESCIVASLIVEEKIFRRGIQGVKHGVALAVR
ncbi:MAG TPA: pyridoxal phosphate-dependent aminotransferase [Bacteroidota bacterium]|nr:pyridoxal phosphate-dependent aminotransferase [Bacteroidota bacterium]